MSSVTAMLKELDWQPLELRRVHSPTCPLPPLLTVPNYYVMVLLWPGPRHIFLISFPTVMLRVHHDMRTHCNMRHTNAGLLNILTSEPFKCYVTLFFCKLDPHPPPRNANNIEHYTFVTLFSRKSDTPICVT